MKYTVEKKVCSSWSGGLLMREGGGSVFSSSDVVFLEHLAEALNNAAELIEKKGKVQDKICVKCKSKTLGFLRGQELLCAQCHYDSRDMSEMLKEEDNVGVAQKESD